MIDENKIKELMENADIPLADQTAKRAAINASMAEYKKMQINSKESSLMGRLIDKLTNLWRFIMSKIFEATRLTGPAKALCGVSIIAIVAFYGSGSIVSTVGVISTDSETQIISAPSGSVGGVTEGFSNKYAGTVKPDTEKLSIHSKIIGGNKNRNLELRNHIEGNEFADDGLADMDEIEESMEIAIVDNISPSINMPLREAKKELSKSIPAKQEQIRRIAADKKAKDKRGFYAGAPMESIAPSSVAVGRIIADPARQSSMNQEYVGRDKFEEIEPNQVKLVSEEPVSTFSIDVDTASYTFARRELNHGRLPQKNAIRVEEMINYFDYDYQLPETKSKPFEPSVTVMQTPWNVNTKLVHIGIKGYDIAPTERPHANLVFLLDVSGSMNQADKLPLLKNSFRMLVDNLNPDDTVSIVVYAGAAGTVLEPTKASNKGKILGALDRLTAGGSTAGGRGIQLAYSLAEANFDKNGVNRIILATDGDFNVGIRDQNELKGFVERKRKTGIYLSVLGFGQGNYNDALMQALAQNGNGNAAYIDNLNEARKVLVDEASSTLFTIANDVKIQMEFNPNMISEYRLIGYETRMLNREDFNNDKVDAGDIGSGHSVTALYEITLAGSNGRLIDDLRYGKNITKDFSADKNSELGFLKIRYKLPGESKSKLITKPIYDNSNKLIETPKESKFAAAVAAFGQKLRGGRYLGTYDYDDIARLAETARGDDKFGYRNEFLNLVRLAKSARDMKINR